MRIEFPSYELMICRGLELLRSEKYKHLFCYAVFSSSGKKSYLLADSKASYSGIYVGDSDIFLICEMHSERREK